MDVRQIGGDETHGNLEAMFHSTVTLHLLLIAPFRLHPEPHTLGKGYERNVLVYSSVFIFALSSLLFAFTGSLIFASREHCGAVHRATLQIQGLLNMFRF
jgi:hypothetical protein